MAEVLSQSQIDALLSAARSGDVNLDANESDASEKKYRKYDFYSPRKFTKDRLKMLNGIFENYARQIINRINGMLHASCDITVDSVEEQRYYEFSNGLTEGDVLTLSHLHYKGAREDSPVLLYVTIPVMLSMMDRWMGGEGAIDDNLPSDYSFTDMELRLYESIMRDLIPPMSTSWENYLPLTFEYERVEVNPTLVQLIGLDETVVIADLKITFPNSQGHMSICLPGMMLTNLFADINRDTAAHQSNSEAHTDEIFESLRGSDLELVAELGRTHLHLRDIYHLNVGDVINLSHPQEEPVSLNVGGHRWFDGKMGIYNKNVAIKITETYHKEQKRGV